MYCYDTFNTNGRMPVYCSVGMTKSDITQFNYQKVAKLDTDMWISYRKSDRKSIGLFLQAFRLIKYELRFSWSTTFKMAYYAGWAATVYRLRKGKENYPEAQKNLTKLFKTVSDNCTKPFNYHKAAKLELEWWDIQRYPKKHKKSLEQSLAENMAAVYNLTAKKTEGYGRNRAKALLLLSKDDKKFDRGEFSKLLTNSWKSLHDTIQNEN